MIQDFRKHRLSTGQDVLQYCYDAGKEREKYHPEVAERHRKILDKCIIYKTEEEALEAAVKLKKKRTCGCQVWAKIERDEEFYYLSDYWVIATDNFIGMAAEYLGMAQVY